MIILFASVLAVGVPIAIYCFGKWILGPIDSAARTRRGPARVSLGDMLCLFVAVQVPLTIINILDPKETENLEEADPLILGFTVVTCFVAPIIWIACALALSRAGIFVGRHRLAFMGLVLPAVYYGLPPFVLFGVMGIALTIWGQLGNLVSSFVPILVWACTGIALLACGLYTHWMVEQVCPDGNAAEA